MIRLDLAAAPTFYRSPGRILSTPEGMSSGKAKGQQARRAHILAARGDIGLGQLRLMTAKANLSFLSKMAWGLLVAGLFFLR
jgi:hypothetical protein